MAPDSYWISLAFTFLGAAIFALARARRGRIPQEAFIGITYAVASAAAILLMSKATHETEHLKDMLVGNILAVSWPEVRETAMLYGASWHLSLHLPQEIPADFHESRQSVSGSESTSVSGTSCSTPPSASSSLLLLPSPAFLLVFCYLIVPSVGAMLFADRIGPRLAIGWTMGTLVSALGCYFSVQMDTPTGATIVVTFGAALVAMFLVHLVLHRRNGDPLKGARAVDQEDLQEQTLL